MSIPAPGAQPFSANPNGPHANVRFGFFGDRIKHIPWDRIQKQVSDGLSAADSPDALDGFVRTAAKDVVEYLIPAAGLVSAGMVVGMPYFGNRYGTQYAVNNGVGTLLNPNEVKDAIGRDVSTRGESIHGWLCNRLGVQDGKARRQLTGPLRQYRRFVHQAAEKVPSGGWSVNLFGQEIPLISPAIRNNIRNTFLYPANILNKGFKTVIPRNVTDQAKKLKNLSEVVSEKALHLFKEPRYNRFIHQVPEGAWGKARYYGVNVGAGVAELFLSKITKAPKIIRVAFYPLTVAFRMMMKFKVFQGAAQIAKNFLR